MKGDAKYIDSMIYWADPESPAYLDSNELVRARVALASMLSKVQRAIEEKLSEPVYNIYAVFPVSQGLQSDDIKNAFQRASLNWLVSDDLPFRETSAAYVGMGYGLCPSFPDMDRCRQEVDAMKFEHVLFLNFDNSSFGAAYHPMHAAAVKWPSPNAYILDTYLGWWGLPVHEKPRAEFWCDIKDVIMDVVKPFGITPSKIILLGDHAGEREFQTVVELALLEALGFDASSFLNKNYVSGMSIAAKGAAEWAFRVQYMSSKLGARAGNDHGKARSEL